MAKAYVRPENHGVSLPAMPSTPISPNGTLSRRNVWGEFAMKLRAVFKAKVPTGYEDHDGFHYGARQTAHEIDSTPNQG